MPPIDADYSFRNTRETFTALLAELERLWAGLADPPRAPLAAALAALRDQLDNAEGDIARGVTLSDFLFTVDKIASLPAGVQQILDQARAPRLRGSLILLNAGDARAFAGRAAALLASSGPADTAAAPEDETAAAGQPAAAVAAPEHLASQALGLLEAISNNWEKLSTRQQDIACELVYNFLADLEAAANDQQREQAAERLLSAVASNPALAEKLQAVVRRGDPSDNWQRVYDAASRSPGLSSLGREVESAGPDIDFPVEPSWVAANGGGGPLPQPTATIAAPPAPYFTDVRFPGQVAASDHDVPLIVRLTVELPKSSRVVERFDVTFEKAEEPELIEVICMAEDFEETTGDPTRTLTVYMGKNSQPAVFLLSPKAGAASGPKRVVLDFVHRGRNLGHASFFTELTSQPVQQPGELVRESTLQISEMRTYEAQPVDLELRVTLGANKTHLMYMLHSPKGAVGYHWQNAGAVQLDEEPRLFLQKTIDRLNTMARKGVNRRTEEETADYRAALGRIGQELYDQIFSDDLKREYAGRISKLRASGVIRNVLITSDEPWIPWELLKPYQTDVNSGDVLVDDDFLCTGFRLTRWLAGRGVPDFVTITDARVIAPPSNLTAVQREIDYFNATLPARLHQAPATPLETPTEVLDALAGKAANLYHFSCHGNFDADNADESPLQLKDGQVLAPSDVIGTAETGVAQSKPLIFLNACYSGQVGRNIRGLGGWAQRFIGKGASAFIGGLWEVNDRLAAEFAITFYDALFGGETLGEAFHKARAHLREMDDANPTWLAYTLYADPNGFAKTPNP